MSLDFGKSLTKRSLARPGDPLVLVIFDCRQLSLDPLLPLLPTHSVCRAYLTSPIMDIRYIIQDALLIC